MAESLLEFETPVLATELSTESRATLSRLPADPLIELIVAAVRSTVEGTRVR